MNDEEMDSTYGEDTVSGSPDTPEVEKPESVDEENSTQAELLIDKSKLPDGSKEGDTVTFRIAKDFGDEVSLEPVTAPKETEPTNDTLSEETSREIAALDTEKA